MSTELDERAEQDTAIATERPRAGLWLHKAEVIAGFLWWMVKVIDWAIYPHGLNRVEFPRFAPQRFKRKKAETLGADSKSNQA